MTLRRFYCDGTVFSGGSWTARRVLTAAILCLACLHLASAAEEPEYSTVPFDATIAAVPPDYRGHDPVAIAAALESEVFSVGDTSLPLGAPEHREYLEERAKTLLDKPLYGELVFRSRLAVVLPNDSECDDPSVVEIQNGTQVHLVDLDANVILEFCYIGKPFLIWSICMKVPF